MTDAVTEEELAAFHRVVGKLRALPVDDPVRLRTEQVAASFARDGRLRRRKARGAETSAADASVMAATATGALDRREDAPLTAPGSGGAFRKPRGCYVCKSPYRQVDSFYHRLCPRCAADNSPRRALSTDLTGCCHCCSPPRTRAAPSSTSPPSRAGSPCATRRPAIRTPTWPRPR